MMRFALYRLAGDRARPLAFAHRLHDYRPVRPESCIRRGLPSPWDLPDWLRPEILLRRQMEPQLDVPNLYYRRRSVLATGAVVKPDSDDSALLALRCA